MTRSTASTPRVRRTPDASAKGKTSFRLSRWTAAVPSLIAMGAAALVAVAASTQRANALDARYHHDADAALAAGDFRTARVCYERLLQSAPNNAALEFALARSLDGLDQPAEAAQILNRLAPPNRAGYVPAHLMIAQQILFGRHDAKSLALAEAHLRRVLESDPANADARALLTSLYANTGRPVPPGQ